MQDSMFIGLDVHKATISIAVANGDRGGEVRSWGKIPNRPDHVAKLVEKLVTKARRLFFCYEAGPYGYGLHRQITGLGHACDVVAPSLVPMKAGDRVKTDRRDALMLARLHRAGELTAIRFGNSAQQMVFQDYVDAVTDQIAAQLPDWSLAPVVEAVQAMRDVAFIVAVTVVAEVGDFNRFDNPRQLMAYLGLTPSEASSGAKVRRGGITEAGNGLARRALIEGAWSYRIQPRVSRKLYDRLEALPKSVRDIAWNGHLRMCRRYRHLMTAGKPKVVATTAIAREMVGFIWAIARQVAPTSA